LETNETVKLETPEDFREGIAVLAKGHVDLEAVVKAQGELIRGMDARIKLLTALLDAHHDIFISKGWAKPRPKADPLAN
jgi:hypothetical protein